MSLQFSVNAIEATVPIKICCNTAPLGQLASVGWLLRGSLWRLPFSGLLDHPVQQVQQLLRNGRHRVGYLIQINAIQQFDHIRWK